MIFYFTATGNSLYAARSLADGGFVSIAQAVHDERKEYADERIGVVCPIFGHEMPELVKRFLAGATFRTDYLYLVLTYGNRHAGAAELAADYARSVGLDPAYVNVVLMADNFLPAFDMDEQRTVDKHVDEQLAAIRADIEAKRRWTSPVTDADRAAHAEYLERMAGVPEGFYKQVYRIEDMCNGCGTCARVCPMACFSVEDGRAAWDSEACIMCMACIHACPRKAIQLNMPEPNPSARYRNEHVKLADIVSANDQSKWRG